jgi:hypothetical protein
VDVLLKIIRERLVDVVFRIEQCPLIGQIISLPSDRLVKGHLNIRIFHAEWIDGKLLSKFKTEVMK